MARVKEAERVEKGHRGREVLKSQGVQGTVVKYVLASNT